MAAALDRLPDGCRHGRGLQAVQRRRR
jgi:hypothetical protein